MTEPIRLEDRISTVLSRDPRMLDVLLAASPTFSHLKNPIMRKTMARLATVEHAARVAGLDADELVARLNAALRGEAYVPRATAAAQTPAASAPKPAIVAQATEATIVDCDVRDDLQKGIEPLSRILAAARGVPREKLLRLRAIFEPVPLYAVLGKQGFAHFTERLADDDWIVWFWRDEDAAAAAKSGTAPAPVADVPTDDEVVVLDVRGLEPPEPMIRTLEALEALPRGKTLVQINERVPQFLIPKLAERGFTYEVREQSPELVRLFIRHKNP